MSGSLGMMPRKAKSKVKVEVLGISCLKMRTPPRRPSRIGLTPRWTAGSCFWILSERRVGSEGEVEAGVEADSGVIEEAAATEAETTTTVMDSEAVTGDEVVIGAAVKIEVVTEEVIEVTEEAIEVAEEVIEVDTGVEAEVEVDTTTTRTKYIINTTANKIIALIIKKNSANNNKIANNYS